MTVQQSPKTERMQDINSPLYSVWPFSESIKSTDVKSIQLADGWHNVEGPQEYFNCLFYTNEQGSPVFTLYNQIISVSGNSYNK